MNILIPFRIEKGAQTLTKVSKFTLGVHHYTVFVVQFCGKHVFVIPFFVSLLYEFFNNTILDETAFAGEKIMATFKLPQWFEATKGLCNNVLDVLRFSTKDVNKEELAQAFGSKSSLNGWRYDYRLISEAAREVEELYCRVTLRSKITNNEPTLQFAPRLFFEGRGIQGNWITFAAHFHSHIEKVL